MLGGGQSREEGCEAHGLPLISAGSAGQAARVWVGRRGKGPLLIRRWFGPQPGGCSCQFHSGQGMGEGLSSNRPHQMCIQSVSFFKPSSCSGQGGRNESQGLRLKLEGAWSSLAGSGPGAQEI